uniref:Glycosyltransferase family 1 protein n=1 Tax=candidate division WWE3 bacterium TaxID=2053526 RepID=A0A832E0Q2_UNCKA
MRIGIDARVWGSSGRGVGRYIQNLVENLERADRSSANSGKPQHEYFIFLREKGFDSYHPKSESFHKVLADVPWYGMHEQVAMPGIFSAANLDLLHVPHFNAPLLYGRKMVVTIHDLTMLKFGGRATSTLPVPLFLAKRVGLRLVIENAVRRSAAVIVPSQFVKDDVAKTFGISLRKIFVTYESGSLVGKGRIGQEREIENVLGKYRITKPYFLYVGAFYPHKNVDRLVEAVKILNEKLKKPAQLVLVGGKDAFLERVVRKALEVGALRYISLTGHVTDADLIDLYLESAACVQPSLSEGFGLQTVEAMSLGVPVVQANASCLPEIGGDAALYFDPYDPQDIAEKLSQVLGKQAVRQKLIEKGRARAKEFSWEKMARETLEVYRKVVK